MARATELRTESGEAEQAALSLPRLEAKSSNAREEDWRSRELAQLQHQRELDQAARDALKPGLDASRGGNSNLTEEAWRAKELSELTRQRELKSLEAQRYAGSTVGTAKIEALNSNKIEEQRRAQELAQVKHQRELDELERVRYAGSATSFLNSNVREEDLRSAQLQQLQRQAKIDSAARQSLSSADASANAGATPFKTAVQHPFEKTVATETNKRGVEQVSSSASLSPDLATPSKAALLLSKNPSRTEEPLQPSRYAEQAQAVKSKDEKNSQARGVERAGSPAEAALSSRNEKHASAEPSQVQASAPKQLFRELLPSASLQFESIRKLHVNSEQRVVERKHMSACPEASAEHLTGLPERPKEKPSVMERIALVMKQDTAFAAVSHESALKSSSLERYKPVLTDIAWALDKALCKSMEQKFVRLEPVQNPALLKSYEAEKAPAISVSPHIPDRPALTEKATPIEKLSFKQNSIAIEKVPEQAQRRVESSVSSPAPAASFDYNANSICPQDKFSARIVDARAERALPDLQITLINEKTQESSVAKPLSIALPLETGKRAPLEQSAPSASCQRRFPDSNPGGASEAASFVVRGMKPHKFIEDRRYLTGVELSLAALIAISAAARSKDDNADRPSGSENEIQILRRRNYLVRAEDTLESIAEELYDCAHLAWLIADINSANIKDEWVEGRRVVELKARQILELPDPLEIAEFQRQRPPGFDKRGLVTVVTVGAIDKELLEGLSPLLASSRKPSEDNSPACKNGLGGKTRKSGTFGSVKIREKIARSIQAIGRELCRIKNASLVSRV